MIPTTCSGRWARSSRWFGKCLNDLLGPSLVLRSKSRAFIVPSQTTSSRWKGAITTMMCTAIPVSTPTPTPFPVPMPIPTPDPEASSPGHPNPTCLAELNISKLSSSSPNRAPLRVSRWVRCVRLVRPPGQVESYQGELNAEDRINPFQSLTDTLWIISRIFRR